MQVKILLETTKVVSSNSAKKTTKRLEVDGGRIDGQLYNG